jgi:hypothetical protein
LPAARLVYVVVTASPPANENVEPTMVPAVAEVPSEVPVYSVKVAGFIDTSSDSNSFAYVHRSETSAMLKL